MAKRRKATPVTLNPEQRSRLERLWFHFGNYGPKSTPGNHSFIQCLLENGIDERPLYIRRTPKSELPTPECESVVDGILSTIGENHLQIIKNTEEHPTAEPDPELGSVLADLDRRYRVMHARLEAEGETPDAA